MKIRITPAGVYRGYSDTMSSLSSFLLRLGLLRRKVLERDPDYMRLSEEERRKLRQTSVRKYVKWDWFLDTSAFLLTFVIFCPIFWIWQPSIIGGIGLASTSVVNVRHCRHAFYEYCELKGLSPEKPFEKGRPPL